MSLPINQIVEGDCLEVIKSFPNESIDLVVTSPPYFANKEYEAWESFGQYTRFLTDVFREAYRIVTPGGRVCINIDDKHTSLKTHGFNKSLGTHAILVANLLDQYDFKDLIIWNKVRGAHASGGAQYMLGSYPYPPEIPIITNFEYILIFRKEGQRHRPDKETRERSKLTFNNFTKYAMGIWAFPAERNRIHPAPFPEELPWRLIRLFSYIDDVILDPFVGSGTTCVVAEKLNRKWIGIEQNSDYCKISRERIANVPVKLDGFIENVAEAVAL